MHKGTRRLAIFFGGALLATFAFVAACSTDNGTTPIPSVGGDSGREKVKDKDDDDDDDDTDPDDGDELPDAGTADCGNAPKLRNNTNGFYCSFFRRDGGGPGSTSCSNDETCCNPGKKGDGTHPPSFCASTPQGSKGGDNGVTACAAQAADFDSEWPAGGSAWECADKHACGAGQVCCLRTQEGADGTVNIGKSTDKNIPAACGALMAFKVGGTRCADSCDADEIQLCSGSDENCSGSASCTPFAALFRDQAYCK